MVFRHSLLHLDRVAHGIDHAAKLGQHPVPHELDDAPAMLGDLGIDDVLADRFEGREGAFLVGPDETAVPDHVSR